MRRTEAILLLIFAAVSLTACSSTKSNIQSAPLEYDQDRAKAGEDVPIARGYVSVLHRDNPGESATESVSSILPNIASSLNPAGALTIFGTQPERVWSEFERGIRDQSTASFSVDLAPGTTYDIHAYLRGVAYNPESDQVTAEGGDVEITTDKVEDGGNE